jgi:hypothetical protein
LNGGAVYGSPASDELTEDGSVDVVVGKVEIAEGSAKRGVFGNQPTCK